MRRRSYLATAGTALSALAAGCISDGDRESTTTGAPSADATATTRTASSVTVHETILQPAALTLETDYLSVRDRGQYVFARVGVEDGPVDPDEYRLRVAGERYAPMDEQERRRLWRSYDAGYDPRVGGLLPFELPGATDVSDPEAVLERPGGEHELAAEKRARLGTEPEFALDVSVPDTVAEGSSLAVAVAVTNEGDAPARFVGGLNRAGPRIASIPVEAVVPLVAPGESWTRSIDQSLVTSAAPAEDIGDGEPDARFTFYSTAGGATREVRIVPDE